MKNVLAALMLLMILAPGPLRADQPAAPPIAPPIRRAPAAALKQRRLVEAPLLTRSVSAPRELRSTTDPTVCAQEGGSGGLFLGAMCQGAVRQKKLILLWNWYPALARRDRPAEEKAEGYRVYRLLKTGWNLPPSYEQVAKADDRGRLALIAGAKPGDCFVVAAYRGKTESDKSNRLCVAENTRIGVQTSVFKPVQGRTVCTRTDSDHPYLTPVQKGLPCQGSWPFGDDARERFLAGYDGSAVATILGDTFDNTFYRSAMLFDIGQLNGKRIDRATLRLHTHGAWDHDWCGLAEVALGVGNWWMAGGDGRPSDWIEFSKPVDAFPIDGEKDVYVDVTREVGAWLAGVANYGFVIHEQGENPKMFVFGTCTFMLTNVALIVDTYD